MWGAGQGRPGAPGRPSDGCRTRQVKPAEQGQERQLLRQHRPRPRRRSRRARGGGRRPVTRCCLWIRRACCRAQVVGGRLCRGDDHLEETGRGGAGSSNQWLHYMPLDANSSCFHLMQRHVMPKPFGMLPSRGGGQEGRTEGAHQHQHYMPFGAKGLAHCTCLCAGMHMKAVAGGAARSARPAGVACHAAPAGPQPCMSVEPRGGARCMILHVPPACQPPQGGLAPSHSCSLWGRTWDPCRLRAVRLASRPSEPRVTCIINHPDPGLVGSRVSVHGGGGERGQLQCLAASDGRRPGWMLPARPLTCTTPQPLMSSDARLPAHRGRGGSRGGGQGWVGGGIGGRAEQGGRRPSWRPSD